MSRHSWLRHPPRTTKPATCPTGLPRFANTDRARDALTYGLTHVALTPTPCNQCGGAHLHTTQHTSKDPTMTTQQPGPITLNRDQLAALLAHHADVLAAQLRTDTARDAWIAAERLDDHADALTAEEESRAVAELLDSMLTFPGVDKVVGMGGTPVAEADTLPAWLHQRFAVGHIHPFEELDEANRSYWDHEARAVRRAVDRGGFKTDPSAAPAATPVAVETGE